MLGPRTQPPRRPRWSHWTVLSVVAAIAIGGVGVGAFALHANSGSASGVQNPAAALTHFQETGVLASATPTPVPVVLSLVGTLPTRLPGVATTFLLNTGVGGHQAVEWTFSESVGILTSQEIELRFSIQYDVGALAQTATVTAFVETQLGALVGALVFTLYWDSGATTGDTFVSESEIAEACTAIGTCP
jgi:hypothetical protein